MVSPMSRRIAGNGTPEGGRLEGPAGTVYGGSVTDTTYTTRETSMQIPSQILDMIADLETRSAMLRREHLPQAAAQLMDLARELRSRYDAEPDTLMTLDQAVRYSRGYNAAYLARHLYNHGTRSAPRYRKGDLPRKPVRVSR